jgi:hypothetical protein
MWEPSLAESPPRRSAAQRLEFNGFPHTRVGLGVINDDRAPERSPNSLKTNDLEKRRKTRRKSSFVVKTRHKPLISLNIE